MPSQVSHREYAEAVLNSVGIGGASLRARMSFQSGNFSRSALPTVSNLIDEARDDGKVYGNLLESPNFPH